MLQHITQGLRDEKIGNAATQHGVIREDRGNAFHILYGGLQLIHLRGGEIVPQQHKVGSRHVVVIFQFVVGDDGVHVLGQRLIQLVVDGGVALGVYRRQEQQQKDGHKRPPVADDKAIHLFKIGDQRPVLVLFDFFVKNQQQCGQHQYHCGHAQHHALGHDQADVPAQGQLHEAQRQETGDGGQAGAGQGSKGSHNGLRHGVPGILMKQPFLPVAVVKEDGVVHGDAQL